MRIAKLRLHHLSMSQNRDNNKFLWRELNLKLNMMYDLEAKSHLHHKNRLHEINWNKSNWGPLMKKSESAKISKIIFFRKKDI